MRARVWRIAVAIAAIGSAHAPGVAANDEPPVKRSSAGICHERGSTYYAQTQHYESFDSLKACLDSGGRLPKAVSGTRHGATGSSRSAPRSPAGPDAGAAIGGTGNAEPMHRDDSGSSGPVIDSRVWTGGGAVAAVAAIWAGASWWGRRRARKRAAADELDAKRRWQGHRLSRYDAADERRLLARCGGDRAQMERLIDAELARDSAMPREQAIVDALERWRRDAR